jgi:hypothetical protein
MITCALRRYGFLLRTLLLDVCRMYLATADSDVRSAVFRKFGVSPEVQTHDKINCSTRLLFLITEFGGLNVPSLAIDVEHAH